MRIVEIETLQYGEFPNLLHVRLRTDEGLTGLGETFNGADAVAAWLHQVAAPHLLGADPRQIERHWQALNPKLGFNSTGVESRARSAVDIALWDILGQITGQPIYQLLGGASREHVRLYNTCAGYHYVRRVAKGGQQLVSNWNVAGGTAPGPYEDLEAFLNRPEELAQSLLAEGITAMKIWPLDPYAERTGGHSISLADLKAGVAPFRRIREAVGDRMELLVELHSLWNLPAAIRIAAALDEFEPYWYEDPIKMDDLGALAEFARSTRVPVAASENLGTRWSFRDLCERRAARVIIFDPAYGGGITEAKKVAGLAEAYQLPATWHDCTGPVSFVVNLHLNLNITNAIFQEYVRAYYTSWYPQLVTELPVVKQGCVFPLSGPGLGTALRPEVLKRPDLTRRVSKFGNG
jgi:L-alanine-DL-glutamate epimerase-like enolase superfamily enzyme